LTGFTLFGRDIKKKKHLKGLKGKADEFEEVYGR